MSSSDSGDDAAAVAVSVATADDDYDGDGLPSTVVGLLILADEIAHVRLR